MPAVSTTIRSKPGGFQQLHGVGEHRAGRQVLAARRERAHEELLVRERVHADAIAQQRAAGAPPGRVHRDDGDLAVREEPHDPVQDLVGQRGLAGAAGAGDAEHRRPVQCLGGKAAYPRHQRLVATLLQRGYGTRQPDGIVRRDGVAVECRPRAALHPAEHVADHSVEAQAQAVVGRVDLLDAIGLEFLDFMRARSCRRRPPRP